MNHIFLNTIVRVGNCFLEWLISLINREVHVLRKTTLWILVALLSFGVTQLCFAGNDTEIGFKADLRYRGEMDGRDFNSDTDMQGQGLLRFRLGTMAQRGNVHGFLQLQYSDQTGWDSGILGQDMVDVHQAWLRMDDFLIDRTYLKVGRMEMAYADERLIGAVGWSNVGRVFDGIVLGYNCEKFMLDLFYTNQEERYASSQQQDNNPDDMFIGMWTEYKPWGLHLYALHNSKARNLGSGVFRRDLERTTIGIHHNGQFGGLVPFLTDEESRDPKRFRYLWNVAYQFGTDRKSYGSDSEVELSGMLFGVEVRSFINSRLTGALGVEYTTGDDPETLDKNESFNNLYYTGHKFHGMMDYFTGSVNWRSGLINEYAYLEVEPWERTVFNAGLHLFSSLQDRADSGNDYEAGQLGLEFDLTVSHEAQDNLIVCGGIGYFMPSDDFVYEGDNAMWGYIQLRSLMEYWLD